MKTLKRSLFSSVLSLFLCVAMLLGTTYAWFTDSVTSAGNKIVSGSLKVDLELLDENNEWKSLKKDETPLYNNVLWEPGYTEVKILKVENEGTLALKWQAVFVAQSGLSELADVIDVYVLPYGVLTADEAAAQVAYPADRGLDGYTRVGTLAEFVSDISATTYGTLEAGESAYLGIALSMQPTAGNYYQDMALGVFDIKVVATQATSENDSFGSDYDSKAEFPGYHADYSSTTSVAGKVTAGMLTESVTIGDPAGDIFANVPSGVQLADGVTSLKLTVASMEESKANVTATHRSEVLHSVDVHIDGIAEGNNVPMVITLLGALPTGLNSNNVSLYHVENGVTETMTLVANPVNHNEFSYDPATGDVVISIASFSEITLYGETKVDWSGSVATGFSGGTGTETDPYIIANGEQLAYFRNEVDSGRNFEGQFVKLTANINLNDINFDPIGFGYDYDGFTSNGKTFNGTFDGADHTIYGLYQNGWDLDPDKKDYSNYTYSMAGGGLFASVVDATITNLTISGADIVFECVDMGVLVGYAQGNCTFQNISIINCTIQNYNRYTGGVVGECSPRYDENGTPLHSNHLFVDITVDSTTVVSSLWGSFDTSLGGILGGKWDKNGAETKVTMKNCDVACTIDAFNDVTSAYQWYAYRRAGMLVGNTEQSANNKALADFLTCENVRVYYGAWNNYHYCEFTNQSGSENADWQNNYPWVRVESGLSCGNYSNPRYGHPIVDGEEIVDSTHTHQDGDEHMVSIPFAQLYGGGQGVYGATEHAGGGVTEGCYTVTYINEGELLKVEFITDNSAQHTLWDHNEFKVGNESPEYWVDADGNIVSNIPENNTKHIIVYPHFKNQYEIRFVDVNANGTTVLYSEFFTKNKTHELSIDDVNAALDALQQTVDKDKKYIEVSWDYDTDLKNIDFASATGDIVIYTKYTPSGTNKISFELGTNDKGETVYKVTGTNKTEILIAIPSHIGTTPVEYIDEDAFAGFANLHSVLIPETITYIGANALSNGFSFIGKGEVITIYYEGSREEWLAKAETWDKDWCDGLGYGTRIFFLNGEDKVDYNEGYLEAVESGSLFWKEVSWSHKTDVAGVASEYINGKCDCKDCNGAIRPDAKYWN